MAKITVAIPTYNRELYLKECIKSILFQSFQDFKVIIFDNHSDYDIKHLVSDFGDSRISLIRNDKNIGNLRNFQKIFNYQYDSDYFIVFHDDDTMYPQLLESEVGILEKDKNIVFVGTNLNFVKNDKQILQFKNFSKKLQDGGFRGVMFCDYTELIRLILRGFNLCFDSVMYRTGYAEDIFKYRELFFKWMDRPFLIEIAKKGQVAIINEKLVNYRIHPNQDSQAEPGDKLDSLFNLYNFYSNNLPQPLSKSDAKLFHRWSANNLILSMAMFADSFGGYIKLLRRCYSKGLVKIKFLNFRGLYYLLKVFIILIKKSLD